MLEHAFRADDFENHLNGAIGGIVREYIKWKTAERLGVDTHGWGTEVSNLIDAFVNWYFDHSIRTTRLLRGEAAKAKKRKVLELVFAHAKDTEAFYYARALSELRKKTPDYPSQIKKEDLPLNIEMIRAEVKQLSESIDSFGLPINS